MNQAIEPPLWVQNDFTVWLESDHPNFEYVQSILSRFADLVKSPEHIHTYRMTPLTLWNAAAAGLTSDEIVKFLTDQGKWAIPPAIRNEIVSCISRYGCLKLELVNEMLVLSADDADVMKDMRAICSLKPFWREPMNANSICVDPSARGIIKQELLKLGYPVEDTAGYNSGEALPVMLKKNLTDGTPFELRDYQEEAVEAFYREGKKHGGSGVLVLPCGAGKTVVGLAAMARLRAATLILTSNVTSVKQWRRELLEKTNIPEEWIGEYAGGRKEVRPVTIATYQILTYRKSKTAAFEHMQLFHQRNWGLIIYDEVHLLPAPVFRVTADIQATRRLGLTATLVREDGHEADVFTLVGPKRYEVPWRALERSGWIAKATCSEILVPMSPATLRKYEAASPKLQHRIAGENSVKQDIVRQLLKKHAGEPTLIIGQYLDQLHVIASMTQAPIIDGRMPHQEREKWYKAFRSGGVSVLVVSKVANFAVDLPDATVAIQISGSFGSRQEEAQRLGRILRPKRHGQPAYFYSLVSAKTREQDFAEKRQLFLLEQGYAYESVELETMFVEESV